jgi:sec-independent protein translocase protein TatB
MFNVTGGELFMILLVALIVLGPERLPSAARRVGQVMGQLRDLSEGFKREVSQALDDPGEPIVKPATRPRLTALDGGAAQAAHVAPGATGSDPVAAAAAAADPPSGGADPTPVNGTGPDQPTATAASPAATPAADEPAEGAPIPDPDPAREPQVAAPDRTGRGESAGS